MKSKFLEHGALFGRARGWPPLTVWLCLIAAVLVPVVANPCEIYRICLRQITHSDQHSRHGHEEDSHVLEIKKSRNLNRRLTSEERCLSCFLKPHLKPRLKLFVQEHPLASGRSGFACHHDCREGLGAPMLC